MAVVLTDGPAGAKRMATGRPNRTFVDVTGASPGSVATGDDGWGDFRCPAGSLSLWVEQP
jgi:alpha-amylase